MNCREAARKLAGYLDGAIRSREHALVREHLDACANCREQLERYRRLSIALANVEHAIPPAELGARIRLSAAQARARVVWYIRAWRRAVLVFENILEPLAVPATGGVLTAVVAFLLVVQGILVGMPLQTSPNELPTNLTQPARLESLAPFPLSRISASSEHGGADLLVLEATLNEQGQVVNYNILTGSTDAALRRQLDQLLLFSRFRPPLNFGRPMAGGRVILNFSEVRVRG